jgi:predicted metal-dependent hydrolase
MEVIVKRSKRRKKTIQARMVDGKMEVLAPAAIPDEALKDHISRLQARLVKRPQREMMPYLSHAHSI